MSLFSFGTKHRAVVAITDTALRCVIIDSSRAGTMRVVRRIEQRLPLGIVSGGIIEQSALFIESLRSFARKLSLGRVHILLPYEAVQIVQLPRTDTALDHKNAVREQLETILADELLPEGGFHVLSIVDDGDALHVSTIATSILDSYQALFKKVGLHVVSWDTPHPDWTALVQYREQSTIIVGIGEHTSTVVLINGGVSVLQRTVPVGYDDLVATVRGALDIQTHEAQKIIARYGVSPEHKEDRVLHALYETLRPLESAINDVVTVWRQKPYKTARERYPIQSMLLHGESSLVPGLHDRLAYATRIPAQHIDIAGMLDIPDAARILSRDDMVRFAPLLWKAHELVK